MTRTKLQRGAAALMAMIVLLAVVTLVMAAVTWQAVAQRRFLDEREHRLQAHWLAQAGIEHAAAQLLARGTAYQGEELRITPDSKVRISVQPVPKAKDTFEVTSVASFPLDGRTIVRSATRAFRIATERLEAVPSLKNEN